MSENTKKIVIFAVSAVGHLNPILTTVDHLIKTSKSTLKSNIKIIIYSKESLKSLIEKVGAEHKTLGEEIDTKTFFQLSNSISSVLPMIFDKFCKEIDNNLEKIVKELENEGPDIIMYDTASLSARWFLRSLRERYDQKICKVLNKFPKIITYSTTMAKLEGVRPTMLQNIKLFGLWQIALCIYKSRKINNDFMELSRKFNIPFGSPFKEFAEIDTNLETINLVFLFPELHPFVEYYPSNVRFIGASIDMSNHLNALEKLSDDSIKNVFSDFIPRNPVKTIDEIYSKNSKKLIYISLGSILQNQIDIYRAVLQAIETFDEEPISPNRQYRFQSQDLCVVMSVGDKCYQEFKNSNIQLPNNVYYAPSVPQLEVLKRASLFITHNGMNSTSESVHFGVPMVCIPLTTDQPAVANRVANELQLGIYLQYYALTHTVLRSAIHNILEDPSFYERSIEYAEYSNRRIGQIEATNIVLNCLS